MGTDSQDKRLFLFTAKPQRSQRELLLINPVRGGINQYSSGLRPNNYAVDFVDLKQRLPFGSRLQGSEAFSFLSSQQKGKIIPPLRSLLALR